MTDYSRAILGDIYGWLFGYRKCVFCNGNKNLSRVTLDAYSGYNWYYFHDSCLQKVINDPDKYKPFVDYANEITTEIGRYNAFVNKERIRKELANQLHMNDRSIDE